MGAQDGLEGAAEGGDVGAADGGLLVQVEDAAAVGHQDQNGGGADLKERRKRYEIDNI